MKTPIDFSALGDRARLAIELGSLAKYLTVGVVNTLVCLAIVFFCMGVVGLGPIAANMVGYGVAIPLSFALNKRWTFQARAARRLAFVRFLAICLIAYGVQLAALWALLRIGCPPYLAQVLAVPPYTAAGFLLTRSFVFKAAEEDAQP